MKGGKKIRSPAAGLKLFSWLNKVACGGLKYCFHG